MFYFLSSILNLLLVTTTVADTNIKNDEKKKPGTFSTPFPQDQRTFVLKDPKDFDIPTDDYHINPSTKQEVANMLAYVDNAMSTPNEDVVAVTSERFEKIQADYAKKEATSTENVPTTRTIKNVLRQNTRPSAAVAKNARSRAFALMTQFVYGARYKLQYGQRLRADYKNTTEFKIGEGRRLIDERQSNQKTIYHDMYLNFQRHLDVIHKNQRDPKYFSVLDLGDYLEMYEKIVKLHVDIIDLIVYLRILDEERRKEQKNLNAKPKSDSSSDDDSD